MGYDPPDESVTEVSLNRASASPDTPLGVPDSELGELVLRKDGRTIAGMFDAVAPRYDRLNHILSLGVDHRWRRSLARALDGVRGPVLDLCTGTGDVMHAIRRRHPDLTCVGLDFAPEMIRQGQRKLPSGGTGIAFGLGDATAIGVGTGQVGAVTVAFGIRNVENVARALEEMYRVLRPDGRLLILEFSVPSPPLLRRLYLAYFRLVLPRVGGWISGVGHAYRYLPASVLDFPEGAAFARLMTDAGFASVDAHRLSGGIATLYVGMKSEGAA